MHLRAYVGRSPSLCFRRCVYHHNGPSSGVRSIASGHNPEELGDAMKFIGPIAKSAGIAFEEVVAAIQHLSNAGI